MSGSSVSAADPAREATRRVLSLIGELLPAAGIITPTQPLRQLGMDSLSVTRLWFGLQSDFGVVVAAAELRECVSAADIADLVQRSAPTSASEKQLLASTDDAATRDPTTPLRLTDLQQAYLMGKQPELTDDVVGCHVYREFEVHELRPDRLEAAWRQLVGHHPMLRTELSLDGTQRVRLDLGDWAMTTRDLTDDPGAKAELRSNLGETGFTADAFPLFDVAVSWAPSGASTVHLSLDATIVDGPSVRLLLQQWRTLYDAPNTELPAQTLTARDCIVAAQSEGDRTATDRDFWRARLVQLPSGPQPGPGVASVDESAPAGRCRPRLALSGGLNPEQWQAIRGYADSHGVSPTAVVLAAFGEVIARHTESEDFTVVLTTSHRPRLPREAAEVVAPLTSTVLFEVPSTGDSPFADAVRSVHTRLWECLDHASVSGMAALRAAHPSGRLPALPVVFTSELDSAADARAEASFGHDVVYAASQTSGVTLDHQMSEHNGELSIRWDVVPSAWPAGLPQAAFADLLNRLLALGDTAGAQTQPLNELQQSYFVARLSSTSAWNGCQVVHNFDVDCLDLAALERAWLELAARYKVLRTFVDVDGLLHVAQNVPSKRWIPVLDAVTVADESEYQRSLADQLVSVGLPMGRGPQAELRVLRHADGTATVTCLLDLLAVDGRSIHRVLRELFACYADPDASLAEHRDASQWAELRTSIAGGAPLLAEAYGMLDTSAAQQHWRRRTAGLLPGPAIAVAAEASRARTRFSLQISGWNGIRATLAAAEVDGDAALAAALGQALATRYGDGFSFPVVRWTELTMPYRPAELTALSWFSWPRQHRPLIEAAREYTTVLAEDAQADVASGLVQLGREVMRRRATEGLQLPVAYTSILDLTDQPLPAGVAAGSWLTCTPEVSLDCVTVRDGDRLTLHWDVVTADFAPGAVQQMFDVYTSAATRLADQAWEVASESSDDRPWYIDEFNETEWLFDDSDPVQVLFERWVRRQPDAIAVRSAAGSLSYAELNAYSNRIARALRAADVGPEVTVGISTMRGPDMVAAVFGVLKAGGAYVPIEPGLPAGRAGNILDDAGIELMLTTSDRVGWQPPAGLLTIDVDLLAADPGRDTANPPLVSRPEHIAYVIFTSGSSGRPKGVAVTHRPVRNLIDWCHRTHLFGPGDLGLCVTSLGFDLSVFDLLGLLGLGAAIYIANEQQRKDPELLAELLLAEPITFWNSAPTTLTQLAPLLVGHAGEPGTADLRLVYLSGDYTPLTLPDQIRAVFGGAEIVSLGGATETTVWSNYFPVGEIDPSWVSIPYGRPISNARYYILDEALRPCPINVEGDLFIGGQCLSAGYYRQPELTRDRFIPDPFGAAGGIMYCTGDRASYYPDGVISFRGRSDSQVKLRGFRVELEEIEHRLRQHHAVADVVVLARRDLAGDTKLAAYVIPTAGATELTPKEVRAFAAQTLPDYMVPNVVVEIDGFPATSNGKLDREALPWPVASGSRHWLLSSSAAATAPATRPSVTATPGAPGDLTAEITAAFEQALGSTVDPAADLWDQGATSFSMVQVAGALKAQHGIVVGVAVLLDEPTVHGIAARLGSAEAPARPFAAQTAATQPTVDQPVATRPSPVPPAQPADQPMPVDFFSEQDRTRFKAGRWNLRPPRDDEPVMLLPASTLGAGAHEHRASRRDFTGEPITLSTLANLLSLAAESGDGTRLYPSAGDCYAVQVYLDVAEHGVTGLAGGAYYFDAVERSLRRLAGPGVDRKAHFLYNRPLHDAAGFGLYLIGERRGIEPLYAEDAERFLLTEAGYLSQTLLLGQAAAGVGLCPVGAVAQAVVRAAFDLSDSALYLHALLGGAVTRQPSPIPMPFAVVSSDAVAGKPGEPAAVSVIGLAGSYPGAADLEQFWSELYAGQSTIGPIPAERRRDIGDHPSVVGGFFNDAAGSASFDSLTFGIAPAEADLLDPQLRRLLPVVWQCLDDAGHTPASLHSQPGRVGVFLGAMWQDYQHVGADLHRAGHQARISATASDAAGRLSHVFGFTGPSVAVDAACSSSLAALHLAVQALRNGDCEVALVAAANMFNHAYHLDLLAGLELLRASSGSAAYDETSPGWLPGEGVGAVLLRLESSATLAGDVQHAVIEGSQLGHLGAGQRFGAPSAVQLADSINQTLAAYGLTADEVDYAECAAAGAVLADAAELEALGKVFGSQSRPSPLPIGTVKPNIGHLEAAAGLAQLTKTVLQVRHQTLAPTLLSNAERTVLTFDPKVLSVVQSPAPWQPTAGRPRRALITAVGATGATAHVVVREAKPAAEAGTGSAQPQAVVLSADNPSQLRAAADLLIGTIEAASDAGRPYRLADLAFTLQTGRQERPFRLATICTRPAELLTRLRQFSAAGQATKVSTAQVVTAELGLPVAHGTLAAAVTAWLVGQPVDWTPQKGASAHRVSLPSHQFHTVHSGPSGSEAHDTGPSSAGQQRDPRTVSGSVAAASEPVVQYLARVFSEVTGVPEHRVQPGVPLGEYGLSSALVAELTARLRADLGPVPVTLFFDQPDLIGVAQALSASSFTPPETEQTPTAEVAVTSSAGAAEPIAIIGVAGRYPDAADLDAFWQNLAAGRDSVADGPPVGRARSASSEPMWGSYLDDIELFDPLLFGITGRDAALMDPQERLFLQVCWQLWEDAGYAPLRLHTAHAGRVGVFAGAMYNEFPFYGVQTRAPDGDAPATGSALAGIANRVSYTFGLTGPSMAVDTMCSASLTAIHLAVGSLRSGECELAVAGGVNLSLHANKFRQQRQLGMTATDHRCASFGAGGDGFVPGEGVGAVLLKPWRQALADGDRVHAVIRASAVNHGGHSNGYMVPSVPAQAEVLGLALGQAGVPAATLDYLEAHGTGTALGDPIEIEALARTTGLTAAADCVLGSVKSNIGHLEAAAGIAGLTKVLLQLRHGQLAPSLHSKRLNPNIDWSNLPFTVQQELGQWPASDHPRRAGISSFGAGGANAHLIVEQTPTTTRPSAPAQPLDKVLALSARTRDQLREVARRLAGQLAADADLDLSDVAFSLRAGRVALAYRAALIVSTREQLLRDLQAVAESTDTTESIAIGRAPSGAGGLHQWRALWPAPEADPVALARHWANGGDLPIGPARLVVALPCYPFERLRCWPEEAIEAAEPACEAAEPAGMPSAGPANAGLWSRRWIASAAAPSAVSLTAEDLVLVVSASGQAALTDAVTRALAPARVQLVKPADTELPVTAGDVVTGWLDLTALGSVPTRWQDVIPLLQQVCRRRPRSALRVLQATRGLFGPPLAGFQTAEPTLAGRGRAPTAGAETAGFTRSLGAEFGWLQATVLDVDLPSDQTSDAAAAILAGYARVSRASEVALRAGVWHEPELRRLPAVTAQLALDPGRVYLVSGGTRGLGALAAEHLVSRGARRLAVLGRHQPTAGEFGGAQLARWRDSGVQLSVFYGPLTDDGGVGEFLSDVRRELGPLAGVLHCAGVGRSTPASFSSLQAGQIAAIWEPKATGFDTLARETADDDLDFFISYSSVSAGLPGLGAGVADYAAANAYLDYAATGRFCTVQWPVWREAGSAASSTARAGESVSDSEGRAVLDQLLTGRVTGAVLVAAELSPTALAVNSLMMADQTVDTRSAKAVAPDLWTVEQSRSEPVASGRVPAWLFELFGTSLHLPADQLDPNVSFAELGVESVLLHELVAKLEVRLGQPLNPVLLLDHPTLSELSSTLGLAADPVETTVASTGLAQPSPAGAPAAPEVSRTAGKVAVIGIGCRLPGAADLSQFWELLCSGGFAVTEVPTVRWPVDELYDPAGGQGRSHSKWGGFLDRIEDFDPDYFGMTERQATDLDPAIRLSLETAAAALRDAGYAESEVAGRRVGVYLGARMSDYRHRLTAAERTQSLGGDQNFIAAWLAHHFDLHGPNLVVDSACSSSLVSVQLACESLLSGSSELALAGGVEVLLDEEPYLDFTAARALSPRGRCASFGRDADGFVPGEGCGLLLLKTLDAALRDGDRVHGVIDAIAVGNDGRTMGLTTPNPASQSDVVRRALAAAGFAATDVGMIEAHGTATKIGDPMELRALEIVFAEAGDIERGSCALGSVKSNIGHLFSAAGVAGLIKALLAVEHAQIPPTLFCEQPHPRCDFDHSVFYLNQALRPWPSLPGPRVAGVSALGLGGTNAHAVVSSAPAREPGVATRHPLEPVRLNRRRLWRDRPDDRRQPDRPAPVAQLAEPKPAVSQVAPARLRASTLALTFGGSAIKHNGKDAV